MLKVRPIDWRTCFGRKIGVKTHTTIIEAPIWLLKQCEYFSTLLHNDFQKIETVDLVHFSSNDVYAFLDFLNTKEIRYPFGQTNVERNYSDVLSVLRLCDFCAEIEYIKRISNELKRELADEEVYKICYKYIDWNADKLNWLKLDQLIKLGEEGYLSSIRDFVIYNSYGNICSLAVWYCALRYTGEAPLQRMSRHDILVFLNEAEKDNIWPTEFNEFVVFVQREYDEGIPYQKMYCSAMILEKCPILIEIIRKE